MVVMYLINWNNGSLAKLCYKQQQSEDYAVVDYHDIPGKTSRWVNPWLEMRIQDLCLFNLASLVNFKRFQAN